MTRDIIRKLGLVLLLMMGVTQLLLPKSPLSLLFALGSIITTGYAIGGTVIEGIQHIWGPHKKEEK